MDELKKAFFKVYTYGTPEEIWQFIEDKLKQARKDELCRTLKEYYLPKITIIKIENRIKELEK